MEADKNVSDIYEAKYSYLNHVLESDSEKITLASLDQSTKNYITTKYILLNSLLQS